MEIAHEALLRAWPRLRGWLDEDRAVLRLSRLLTAAAAEWKAAGGADGFLLRGARLDQLAPLAGAAVALTEGERRFLDASLTARAARTAAEEARQKTELATAQKLAATERQRADEQATSAGRLRRRAALLAGALGLAVILAVAALLLGRQAGRSATLAQANAAVAQTAEVQAVGERATAEAERARAEAGEAAALSAEATAAAEAGVRATAEAVAIHERETAEEQTRLAISRELAASALAALSVDSELGLLLALQALSAVHTQEAENVLHKALPNQHLLATLPISHVWVVQNSPDGRYLAVGTSTGLKVWDVPALLAGSLEPLLFKPSQLVWIISYSADGTQMTTLGDAGLQVLDSLSGEVLAESPGYPSENNYIVLSPDNSRLAIADHDGNLSVWDLQSREELFKTAGHEHVAAVNTPRDVPPITQIEFSPDGSRLASSGTDGTARIWDANTGRELMTLTGHVNEVNTVSFSYDGQQVATGGSDGTARIWDISSEYPQGRLVLNLNHDQSLYSVEFSPDDRLLATGVRGGDATIWDTASGRRLMELNGHTAPVMAAFFSPDGTRLLTYSTDMSIKIWDAMPGRELFALAGPGGPVGGPAFSPDGLHLATGHVDGSVAIWERASGQLLRTLPAHDALVVDLAFDREGTGLATASWDGTAKVWDMAAIIAGDEPEPIIFSGHTDRVWRVDFSPDGTRLATGSVDRTAKIWDVESGALLATVTGQGEDGNRIAALEISPDGTRLATNWADGNVKIWDLTTTATVIDEPLLTLPAETIFINDVAFSPNGTLLAVGKEEGPVTIWDISGAEGQEVSELTGHSSSVAAVDFSPDGSRLATGSFDGTVKVWDMAQRGRELFTLATHSDAVIGAAFSPDGRQLASASFDGTAQVYVLETDDLIALAHDRLTRWWRPEECLAYLHTEECPPAPERFAATE